MPDSPLYPTAERPTPAFPPALPPAVPPAAPLIGPTDAEEAAVQRSDARPTRVRAAASAASLSAEAALVDTPESSRACQVDLRFSSVAGGLAAHSYIVTSPNTATDPAHAEYFRGGPTVQAPAGARSSGDFTGGTGAVAGSHSNSANGSSPGSGRGAPGQEAGRWGAIQVNSGRYVPGTVDWPRPDEAPHATQMVVHDGTPCARYNANFGESLRAVERANVPYSPLGYNSNSVAGTLLRHAGIEGVEPARRAPGFDHDLLPQRPPPRPHAGPPSP